MGASSVTRRTRSARVTRHSAWAWCAAAVAIAAVAPVRAESVSSLLREADRLLLPWHGEGSYDTADRKRLIEYTERALGKAREAERLAPEDARVQHRLGVCLSLLKRYEEAEAALTRAEQRAEPKFLPIVLQDQALCATRQGHYDRALEIFRRILDIRPWQPDTRYHMGWIYEQRGQTDLALQLYAQELNHHNRNSKAWQAYYRLKGLKPVKGRSMRNTLILLGVWVGVLLVAGGLYAWLRSHRRSAAMAEASGATGDLPASAPRGRDTGGQAASGT